MTSRGSNEFPYRGPLARGRSRPPRAVAENLFVRDKKYLPTARGLAREHGVYPITVSQGTSGGQRWPAVASRGERALSRSTRERWHPELSVFNSTPYNSAYPFTASRECL